MPKKTRPTDKQKAFVKAKLENPGISNYQAAIQAGYSEDTAKNPNQNIMEKRGVKEFLDKLAPDDIIAQRLNEGLEAWKRDQYSGELYPDFKERREYVDDILTLKGYKPEGNDGAPKVAVAIQITRGDTE